MKGTSNYQVVAQCSQILGVQAVVASEFESGLDAVHVFSDEGGEAWTAIEGGESWTAMGFIENWGRDNNEVSGCCA